MEQLIALVVAVQCSPVCKLVFLYALPAKLAGGHGPGQALTLPRVGPCQASGRPAVGRSAPGTESVSTQRSPPALAEVVVSFYAMKWRKLIAATVERAEAAAVINDIDEEAGRLADLLEKRTTDKRKRDFEIR